MEDYGCACEGWLRESMTLENGIPRHDTFSRVIPALLELIDVKGRTVTEAMPAQRAVIVARDGGYALALKGNQGTQHEAVATFLDSLPELAKHLSHQQVGKGPPPT